MKYLCLEVCVQLNKKGLSNYTHEYFLLDEPPGTVHTVEVLTYGLHGKEVLLAIRATSRHPSD
jgi:hypothetical protein